MLIQQHQLRDHLGVLDADRARRPEWGVEGQRIEPCTVGQDMTRRVHVRARMRTTLQRGDVGRLSPRQVLRALDTHTGSSGQCTSPEVIGTERSLHAEVISPRTDPRRVALGMFRLVAYPIRSPQTG